MVRIPSFSLDRQIQQLHSELLDATDRVLRRSRFVLGEEVEAFEAEFAAYLGVGACVGVASGTSALELALRALGIGPGDEVIVPAFTAGFTALGVMAAGCTPVLVDVQETTGTLDPEAAAAAIGPRTAAIVAVHLYGRPADMEGLTRLASRRGLALVEDCAQAHGAEWQGCKVGTLGTVGCFSFYPTKNLGALGDAGAVVSSDALIVDKVRRLRHGGQQERYAHVEFGTNARLDELQAAYLRIKLKYLDRWNERRWQIALRYRQQLAGLSQLRFPEDPPGSKSVYHIMAVKVPGRDSLARDLAGMGIATDVHYPSALPDLPAFRGLPSLDVPKARLWASTQLSLPMFPELQDSEVDEVCQALVQVLQKGRWAR